MPTDYDAMRMLRFRVALLDFFRRWSIHVAIVVALFSIGSNAPVAVATALAGTLVAPLRHAADHGWHVVIATVSYALVGTLPVVLTRPLWWPRRWASGERALPLSSAVLRRSDRRFSLLVMLPWQVLLAIGGAGMWIHEPGPEGSSARWEASAAWLLSAIASHGLSVAWMARTRRGARANGSAAVRSAAVGVSRGVRRDVRTIGARWAVVALPLARARARRSATCLAGGVVATAACASAPLWSALPTAWSLALAALAAQAASSLTRAATVRELQPLWAARRALPIDRPACERARLLLVLLPMIVGLTTAWAVLPSTVALAHPRASLAYGIALAVGCALEALTPPTMATHDHAARWFLTIAIAIAFASTLAST